MYVMAFAVRINKQISFLTMSFSSDFNLVKLSSCYSIITEKGTTAKYVLGLWNPSCERRVRDKANI